MILKIVLIYEFQTLIKKNNVPKLYLSLDFKISLFCVIFLKIGNHP